MKVTRDYDMVTVTYVGNAGVCRLFQMTAATPAMTPKASRTIVTAMPHFAPGIKIRRCCFSLLFNSAYLFELLRRSYQVKEM